MQRLRKCLGIDIGAASIKIAEVVAEKSGVRVTKLLKGQLGLSPGPLDTERINVVARAVRDLLKDNKVTTKQAVFCVAGQSVFIRRIRVPRTSEERLHRIVTYEAKQQIPFALDNSIMEYQVFDSGDESEVEVLLVAIKKDIVTDFMKIVSKTGLKPVLVSVSSLALYNFHVFDSTSFEELQEESGLKRRRAAAAPTAAAGEDEIPDVADAAPPKKGFSFKLPKLNISFGKKKGAAAAAAAALAEDEAGGEDDLAGMPDMYEEVRAYVNIGAQTFDLAIARLGQRKTLGFTRSVPWAGNELSRSLQDKLGLETFEAGEEMKRERALVVVPGREDEVESLEASPEACEFATAWADRLILDLRKSFDYYISQPDGMAVDTIVLSGAQSLQRNLADYVEEKLGIPVTLKENAQNEALALPEVEEHGVLTSYLIALGLAFTGVGCGQVTVDFLPSELKTIREFKKKNIEVVLIIAAIMGMIAVGSRVGSHDIDNMENWLMANRDTIDRAIEIKNRLKDARDKRENINQRITKLGEVIGDRAYWLEFLAQVESHKPSDILITAIRMSPTGEVEITCETEVVSSISAFASEMGKVKDFVSNVDLSSPAPKFSAYINKEVFGFILKLSLYWKDTRLIPARQTLLPGLTAPTPVPTQAPMPGGAPPGMVPGGPGAVLGI